MFKRFIVRLGIFFLPLGVYLILTIGAPLYGGEYAPLNQVVASQMGDKPVIYGRAYWDDQFAYKLLAVKARHPTIVVIGSSRVMQFRSGFFREGLSVFYNAGGAARSLEELQAFLDDLTDKEIPTILMVGLDEEWVNPKYQREVWGSLSSLDDNVGGFELQRALFTSQTVAQDFLAGKINIDRLLQGKEPLANASAIGFNAIFKGNGFRNDGSHQYGELLLNPQPTSERIITDMALLRKTNPVYLPGQTVDEKRLDVLDTFLSQCKKRGVFVIGFSPPFASSTYKTMMTEGGYTYIPQQTRYLKTLFEHYGFAYFDYSNAAWIGIGDDAMINDTHSSEYGSMKIYLDMLRALPDKLGIYSDLPFLEETARKAHDPFQVFNNNF